jgi:hypothetical protein
VALAFGLMYPAPWDFLIGVPTAIGLFHSMAALKRIKQRARLR